MRDGGGREEWRKEWTEGRRGGKEGRKKQRDEGGERGRGGVKKKTNGRRSGVTNEGMGEKKQRRVERNRER